MAERYVVASGGLTSGTAATVGTAWTLAYANANLSAGDIALLQNGTYTTQIRPTTVPTSSNRIAYVGDGNNVIIEAGASTAADLSDRPYVSLESLIFYTEMKAWVFTNGASDGVRLIDCYFDSDEAFVGEWGGTGYAATGITLNGDDCWIDNCHLEKWLGVDGIRIDGARVWAKNSYFGNSGHGTIHFNGDYYVVENNYFRNKWARAANFSTSSSDSGDQFNGLVQGNIFFDGNYIDLANGGDPAAGWIVNIDSDGPGDEQAVGKAGGSRLIFRDNLVVYSHTTQNASNTYRADCQIGNYNDSPYWRRIRAYHNTHLDGEVHPWSITWRSAANMDARDSRFLNNVWMPIATDKHGIDNVGFWFNTIAPNDGSGSYTLMDTWQFHNNVNPRGWRYSGSVRTVAQFEALFPSAATGNLSGTPSFVDDDYSAAIADLDLRIERANFALASGSVGKGVARALATVAANSSGTTLTVGAGEAWFFSDGNGVVTGDEIIVDGQTTTVTAVPTSSTLTISPAINASIGDEVWLAAYGESPDIGIFVETDEPPAGMTPELLDTVSGSTSSPSVTSNSVSIDAGDFLIVGVSANNAVSGALGTPMSIGDTFAESLTWTKVEVNRSTGSGTCVAFFTALATQSGSGTATVTFANNCTNKVLYFMRLPSGFDSAAPVVQSKTYTGGNSSPTTVTFNSAPQADSLSIGILGTRGTTGPYTFTPDTDYTELAEVQPSTGHGSMVQYLDGGADSTVAWTGSFGGTGVAAIVLEIAAADVSAPFTATGSGTLAPLEAFALADFTPPGRTATGAAVFSTLSATGDASFEAGTFIATGQSILPALDGTGTAAHDAPVFDAMGAATLAPLTATALADHTAPTFAAAGSSSLGTLTGAGLAEFNTIVFDGTGASTLPALDATGSALHTAPIFEAMGASTLGALSATGEADVTDPFFQATGTPSLGALSASGLAEFNTVIRTANGAPSLASLGMTGNGQTHVPVFDGTGAPSLGPLSATGEAVLVLPGRDASGSVTLPLFSASGEASYLAPIRTASGALVLSVVTAAGTVNYVPPVIYTATGSGTMPALAAFAFAFADDPIPTPPPRIIARATVEI